MVTTRPVLSALHVAGLMAITGLVLWDGDEAGAVVRWVLGLMWVSSLLIPWLMGLLISLDLETRLREALAKHGCPPRIEKPM